MISPSGVRHSGLQTLTGAFAAAPRPVRDKPKPTPAAVPRN